MITKEEFIKKYVQKSKHVKANIELIELIESLRKRYIVDRRLGVVAVIDTENTSYLNRKNIKLEESSLYVIAIWQGIQDENGDWFLLSHQIGKAKELAKLLNEAIK